MHELQEQGLAPTMSTFKAGILLCILNRWLTRWQAVIAACAYSMRWSDALDHLQALQRSQLVGTPRNLAMETVNSKSCSQKESNGMLEESRKT